MNDTSSVFPAFLRLQMDGKNVFAEFERSAAAAAGNVERHFKGSLDEVARITQRALSQPLNASGALDLGVAEMRQASAAADQRAQALRRVADAANAVAQREGTLTSAQQAQTAAVNAAAFAAEREAATIREKVVTYDILQRELNEAAAATTRMAGASTAVATTAARTTASIGAQRAGMQQLSYQIGDVSQQLSLGVNPAVVFGQQFGQITQAMQLMYGQSNRLVNFLAGPWGAVLTGAVTVAGLMAVKLFDNADAAAQATAGADALGTAQSVLGTMFDLTSGKLQRQNDLLLLNARLTAINLRADAQARRSSSEATFREAGEVSTGTYLGAIFRRGSGSSPAERMRIAEAVPAQLRGYADAIRNARTDAERTAALDRALRETERLNLGNLSGVSSDQWRQAIIDAATARQNDAIAAQIDETLNSGILSPGLRRTGSKRRPRRPTDQTEFGEDAGRRLANIGARFLDTPSQVEAVRRAMADLDDIASDIERRKPPNYAELVTQLAETRAIVADGLLIPFNDMIEQQDRQLQIQRLINDGREQEAETLQYVQRMEEQIGTLSEGQRAAIAERVRLRAEEARQAEVARREQQAYNQVIEATRSGLESTLLNLRTRGIGALGDFASQLQGSFNQLTAQSVIESLFGGAFRELEDYVSGRGRLREANEEMADSAGGAGRALDDFADAVGRATGAVTGQGAGSVGLSPNATVDAILGRASANWAEALEESAITVTARRIKKDDGGRLHSLDPTTFLSRNVASMVGAVLGSSDGAQRLARAIGDRTADAMQGIFVGQSAAGLLLGSGSNSTGAAIGGALGNVAGKALGNTFGKALGSLGQFAGPIGSIVGGLAGSLLGSALSSTPRASSTIGGSGDRLAITGTTGTRRLQGQTVTAADSVIGTLERIAEMFGATVNAAAGSVSIGIRDGNYRVDPTGRGNTKLKKGAIDFGQDANAAVRAAVLDMITDGVLVGLRQGTQTLLRNAKDIEAGVQRALRFESVFVRLKEFTDPIGAALDAVEKDFLGLRRIFADAGASAAELADLEKLYQLERARAVEEGAAKMTGALRGLIDDLTVNNDARSLRERLAIAQARYDPLAARVAAGDTTVDYDAFAEAARMVEQLVRQIYGSGADYFAVADNILALSKSALDAQQGRIDAAAGTTTGPPSHNVGPNDPNYGPIIGALDNLGAYIVDGLSPYLDALLRQGSPNGSSRLGIESNLGLNIHQF